MLVGLCSSYIDGLPEGLASFPDCLGRRDVFVGALDETPSSFVDARLREAVAALPADEVWIPEVVCAAIVSAHADSLGDEQAYLSSSLSRNLELFRRPLFRGLMFVLSPTLVLMGAARRWGAFHRGSTLEVQRWERETAGNGVRLRLTHAPGLFLPLHHRGFGEAFRAAVLSTRQEQVDVGCTSHDDGATYSVEYGR